MAIPEGVSLRSAEAASRYPRRGIDEGPVVPSRPHGSEGLALLVSSDPPRNSVLYLASPPYRGVWRGDLIAYVPPSSTPEGEAPKIADITKEESPSPPSKVDWIDVVGWVLSIGGASASVYLISRGMDENNWDMQAAGSAMAMTAGMWTLMEIVDRSASPRYPSVNRGVRFGIAAGTGLVQGLLIKYAHLEFKFRPEDYTFIDDNPSPPPPQEGKLPVTEYGP